MHAFEGCWDGSAQGTCEHVVMHLYETGHAPSWKYSPDLRALCGWQSWQQPRQLLEFAHAGSPSKTTMVLDTP